MLATGGTSCERLPPGQEFHSGHDTCRASSVWSYALLKTVCSTATVAFVAFVVCQV